MTGEHLNAEEIQRLEEDGIFLPPAPGSHPGKRQVSVSLYPIPGVSSSSSSSASVRTSKFGQNTVCTDFPIEEESAAVLEYLGFETSTANQIFERYAHRHDPENCPDDLMGYACGQIAALRTSRYQGLDVKEAMSQVGLQQQVQSAIADPEFSDILWTRDLHYWVKDTIEINYATLRSRQELFKRHAGRRIADKNKGVAATINLTTQDFRLPPNQVVSSEDDPATRPDHTVLYKGKAYWDMRESQQLIRDDGSIDMSTLSSPAGGDFNSNVLALYWTPEKETAERYREWAARRCPGSDTCIIRIEVSNAFVESQRSAGMWYSADWKEFVWNCRRQELDLPSQFDYLRNVDLVKGHVCSCMGISRISSTDAQTHITRDNAGPATQWVIWKTDSVKRWAEEIRGKTHIQIFAAAS